MQIACYQISDFKQRLKHHVSNDSKQQKHYLISHFLHIFMFYNSNLLIVIVPKGNVTTKLQ